MSSYPFFFDERADGDHSTLRSMKSHFYWSITTKLLLMNIVIFLIIGAIIFVVNASFERIDRSLSIIIHEDVKQVIENTQLSRELHYIFTRTTLFLGAIHDDEEFFRTKGQELLNIGQNLNSKTIDERLHIQFLKFLQILQTLIEQKIAILTDWLQIQASNDTLLSLLNQLEARIAEKLLPLTMEDQDTANLTQISVFIPNYRDLLRQIMIILVKIRQEVSGSQGASVQQELRALEKIYPALPALFQELHLKLQILLAADQDIANDGEQLVTLVRAYQTHVLNFYAKLQTVREDMLILADIQADILAMIQAKDSEIAQASGKLQYHVASVIGNARGIMLALTATILLVLMVSWLITRWMTRPLLDLSRSAAQLANGDISCGIREIQHRDEIGDLSQAFMRLIAYFREMAATATQISQGHVDLEIQPRSEKDVFGNQFQQMILYLKNIADMANHVAHGDLRQQIVMRSEQDQLGSVFIQMQKGLSALITEIRSGAGYISSVSQQIFGTAVENSQALEKIGTAAEVTSSAMREVSASAEEVRMNTEQLSSSVEQTSASINQMIASISHIAENSRKLSKLSGTTSATVAQIVASLEKVAQQTEHSKALSATTTNDATSGQNAVEQMIEKMQAISQITRSIAEIILELEQRSTDIGRILDVIDEVADQTSMLSLNASIIAAQAGVHGRGFAVVANEIKELAQRVGTSTNEIAKIIKSVQRDSSGAVSAIARGQQEVDSGVVVAQQAGEALEKIRQSAQNSSQVAAEIAVLVRQQTTASTRIAESINDVANMSAEITRATHEQETNSTQLFDVVENMHALAMQVFRATQEQQQSTRHVTEFMEDVIALVEQNVPTVRELAQTADELTDQAENLTHQVERFMIPQEPSILQTREQSTLPLETSQEPQLLRKI